MSAAASQQEDGAWILQGSVQVLPVSAVENGWTDGFCLFCLLSLYCAELCYVLMLRVREPPGKMSCDSSRGIHLQIVKQL